jgi:hypothetical protein
MHLQAIPSRKAEHTNFGFNKKKISYYISSLGPNNLPCFTVQITLNWVATWLQLYEFINSLQTIEIPQGASYAHC